MIIESEWISEIKWGENTVVVISPPNSNHTNRWIYKTNQTGNNKFNTGVSNKLWWTNNHCNSTIYDKVDEMN